MRNLIVKLAIAYFVGKAFDKGINYVENVKKNRDAQRDFYEVRDENGNVIKASYC